MQTIQSAAGRLPPDRGAVATGWRRRGRYGWRFSPPVGGRRISGAQCAVPRRTPLVPYRNVRWQSPAPAAHGAGPPPAAERVALAVGGTPGGGDLPAPGDGAMTWDAGAASADAVTCPLRALRAAEHERVSSGPADGCPCRGRGVDGERWCTTHACGEEGAGVLPPKAHRAAVASPPSR
jgi:hypothetical protein